MCTQFHERAENKHLTCGKTPPAHTCPVTKQSKNHGIILTAFAGVEVRVWSQS